MKASLIFIGILAAVLNSTSARGGDFDGSKPIICSLIQVVACPRTGEIEKETPEGVNLPQFFLIDVEKKTITAKGQSGEARQSTIETVKHEDGTLILGGVQLGKAWQAVINEETGKATITGATVDTAFVVFAACTVNLEPLKTAERPTVPEAAGAEKKKTPE